MILISIYDYLHAYQMKVTSTLKLIGYNVRTIINICKQVNKNGTSALKYKHKLNAH